MQLAIRQENRVTLTPTNMAEAMEFAGMLANSDIVPKDFQGKPGNVLVAIQWGMELGLQPMQAMQNIAVINGRPSLWGDAVLALVRSCPDFESISETYDETTKAATCTVKRKGEAEVTRTFSMEDAKTAGLAGKSGAWQQYPKRMCQMRARSFALRDLFTDVLKGLWIAEEAADTPPEEKDVTSQGETVATSGHAQQAPSTNADKAREALNKRKDTKAQAEAAGVDTALKLADVLVAIAHASSPAEMNAAKELAGKLPSEDDKERARERFKERLAELKGPQHHAHAVNPETGEIFDDGDGV